MEKLSFKVADFEGPLDLLLFLISKHKIDLYDIPIAQLLEQYMAYLSEWQSMDLEIASEFLEMAARLVYMKTVLLLPKPEEAEALKQELTGQLLEYQLCREVAAALREKNEGAGMYVRSPLPIPVDKTYTLEHAPGELLAAYLAAVGKSMRRLPPPAAAFRGIVARRIVSVSSKIVYVLKRLYRESSVSFSGLFEEAEDRSDLVATFLAVLELIKSKRVAVDGGEVRFTPYVRQNPRQAILEYESLPESELLSGSEEEKLPEYAGV